MLHKLFSGIVFLTCAMQSHAQKIWHEELLGKPTDSSITLQMLFSDSASVMVKYGTDSSNLTSQTGWTTYKDSATIEISLKNLLPDTKYYYRVQHKKPNDVGNTSRKIRSFRTARPKDKTFVFTIQADPHLDEQIDTNIYNRCLQNQLEDAPDFMIDLGDIVMTDKLKNKSNVITRDTIVQRFNQLRYFYEKIGHSVPIYISLGNHEGEAGWNLNGTSNNIAVWNVLERKKYFQNVYPNNFYKADTATYNFVGKRSGYYAWTWGDALFVVLDPYWFTNPKPDSLNGWRWTLGKNQYDWLKQTLEQSKSTYKFIFAHQIIGGDPDGRGGIEFADLYEWGGKSLDGTDGFATNRPGWYKPIKELLKENRVNIFFHGHDHFFGKQEKDCLIYQETPQPGHPNFMNAGQAKAYGYLNGQILPNSGHIRVTVAPEGCTVEYIRAYKASDETSTRKNKDVSATYFIGKVNCYDSLKIGAPVLWNADYLDELVSPNPFKTETNIEFSLTTPAEIDMKVFNSKGEAVRTLLQGNRVSAGRYQMIWDGRDGLGNALSDGQYIYVIASGQNKIASGKLMLIR